MHRHRKGTEVTKAHHPLATLIHRSGVDSRARSSAFRGTGAPLNGPRRRGAGLTALALFLLALALTATPALAARGHVFATSFGEPGAGDGQLTAPAGLAVNESTHDVYVVDKGDDRVERFSAAGAYLGQFNGSGLLPGEGSASPTGQFSAPEGIAVDNSTELTDPSRGDVYVVDTGHHVIDKFTATGEYLGQIAGTPEIGSFGGLDGVGVDTHGALWVADKTYSIEHQGADRFNDALANEFVEFVKAGVGSRLQDVGFAVDSMDDLYLRYGHSNRPVIAEFSSTGERLNEAVGGEYPEAALPTGIATELSTDDVYVNAVGEVRRFGPTGAEIERLGAEQLNSGTGVAVDSATGRVYAADSAADLVDVFPLEPPAQPRVESDGVSNVTANSATLEAEINPRSEPSEAATEYRFEYGRCPTLAGCAASPYEQSLPVPDGQLPVDFEVHTVTVHLENLVPHTTYHFRVIAHNSHPGTAAGDERTFTSQTAVPLGLPDARAWELVSPPNKHGGLLEAIGAGNVIQAAADGGAFTYLSSSPTEAEPSGYSNRVQVLSVRGPSGWSSRDIATPHEVATGVSVDEGQEYRFFSEDLSRAALNPLGAFDPSLSAEATEQTPYLRADFPPGDPTALCAESCYTPLVNDANVPPETHFGQQSGSSQGTCPTATVNACGPTFLDATPDLGHAVLTSHVGLTATPGDKGGLYEWSAGELTLISQVPTAPSVWCGGAGPACTPKPASVPVLGNDDKITRNAISADGSRVVFSEHGSHLYLRDLARGETVQLDAVQGGTGENPVGPVFQFASADDSKVFFTDNQRLTADSGGGREGAEADLYQCEIIAAAGHLECNLTDLTPEISGQPARVQKILPGASADGSYLYFVANGDLTGEEVNPQGEKAVHGTCAGVDSQPSASCNLYLDRFDGSAWHIGLVAVLSAGDYPDWNGHDSELLLDGVTARVSPDGRWLAFMSQRSLTGYDNRDAVSGKPDEEVFLYHAPAANGEAGTLACASCNPTGARPHGAEYGHLDFGLDGSQVWGASGESKTQMLAASLPAWTSYEGGGVGTLHQPRYLADSGRLFFNATDALVPQDSNGTGDVYEFEPPGVGDCTESSPSFDERSSGCVGLISSGTSPYESGFLDASENGGDVFFYTNAKLSPSDIDSARDVYDARVEGGFPEPPKPVECQGDACQSPGSAPNDPTPGSLTFQGPGNLTFAATTPVVKAKAKPLTRAQKLTRALRACAKRPKRKRPACKRRARRAYGPAGKAKRSNRRAR